MPAHRSLGEGWSNGKQHIRHSGSPAKGMTIRNPLKVPVKAIEAVSRRGAELAEEDLNSGEGTFPVKSMKADLPQRTRRNTEEGKSLWFKPDLLKF